jgi:copper(I)-binding protein
MTVLLGLAVLQLATTAPQVVVVPGPAGPRAAGPVPSASPAANERVSAGDLTLSNGHLMTYGRGISARGGFFIANAGDTPDRLLRATSPSATAIRFTRVDRNGEVEIETVEIAPNSSYSTRDMQIDFNRGRIQMRLDGLRLPANPADGVPITLEFERAGAITVRAFGMVPQR